MTISQVIPEEYSWQDKERTAMSAEEELLDYHKQSIQLILKEVTPHFRGTIQMLLEKMLTHALAKGKLASLEEMKQKASYIL